MERRQIGVVQDLFGYPVKSLLGERPSAVDIGMHGVMGDRAYALREANGRIVTAKKWANMFEFCARYSVLLHVGSKMRHCWTGPKTR